MGIQARLKPYNKLEINVYPESGDTWFPKRFDCEEIADLYHAIQYDPELSRCVSKVYITVRDLMLAGF